jgi:hypothetical protein
MGSATDFNPAAPFLCTLRKTIEEKVQMFENLFIASVIVPLLGEGLCQRDAVLRVCSMVNQNFAQIDIISCGGALAELKNKVLTLTAVLGAIAAISVDPSLVVARV